MCADAQYLGRDLEELRGRTVFVEDEELWIPLVSLPGVVLSPGQTVPLHAFHQSFTALLTRLRQTNRTFGVVVIRCVCVFLFVPFELVYSLSLSPDTLKIGRVKYIIGFNRTYSISLKIGPNRTYLNISSLFSVNCKIVM